MIKAKITKNIIRKTDNTLGLSFKQIAIGIAAAVTGVIEYIGLKPYIQTTNLMTLIFITLAVIILFGCVNIQGMNLFTFFVKTFKGPDIRYYEQKGVFTNELIQKETKNTNV